MIIFEDSECNFKEETINTLLLETLEKEKPGLRRHFERIFRYMANTNESIRQTVAKIASYESASIFSEDLLKEMTQISRELNKLTNRSYSLFSKAMIEVNEAEIPPPDEPDEEEDSDILSFTYSGWEFTLKTNYKPNKIEVYRGKAPDYELIFESGVIPPPEGKSRTLVLSDPSVEYATFIFSDDNITEAGTYYYTVISYYDEEEPKSKEFEFIFTEEDIKPTEQDPNNNENNADNQ